MTDWISVDDKLPDELKTVWIYSTVCGGIQASGWYRRGDNEYHDDRILWFYDIDGRQAWLVTHWRPLPDPPGGGV